MGGMCDEPIAAATYEEWIDKGWKHILQAHPEMAENIQRMPKDDPKMQKWEEDSHNAWEAAPEV
jgi:hypothetical protein